MRIAFVTPGMLPALGSRRSSVELAVDETSRWLAQNNDVSVYGRGKRGRTTVKPSGVRFHLSGGHSYARWLAKRLVAGRPDIVQVENRPLLARTIRRSLPSFVPVLLALHSTYYIDPAHYPGKAVRAALRNVDGVIVNSDGLARVVRILYPRACRRLWRVHLGVNTDDFRPATDPDMADLRRATRLRLHLPAKAKVILFVGRLIPQKGVHHLLTALPAVRRSLGDVRLIIVGGTRCGGNVPTPYERSLRRRIRSMRPTASMVDYVPHRALPAFYAAADVVATPSVGHEALNLVNLEAMAAGLPVVSTRIGGIPEVVVHGETGLLVSPRTIKRRLAPAIISALAWGEILGRNGRLRVESDFTWRRTAEEYERIYLLQVGAKRRT